jgi:hypothetical protein
MCIVAFPRQRDKKLCWSRIWTNSFIGHSRFALTIQLFTLASTELTSSLLQHSCTANLGEASSALVGAQMSLALFGYELSGLLSDTSCYILHSN